MVIRLLTCLLVLFPLASEEGVLSSYDEVVAVLNDEGGELTAADGLYAYRGDEEALWPLLMGEQVLARVFAARLLMGGEWVRIPALEAAVRHDPRYAAIPDRSGEVSTVQQIIAGSRARDPFSRAGGIAGAFAGGQPFVATMPCSRRSWLLVIQGLHGEDPYVATETRLLIKHALAGLFHNQPASHGYLQNLADEGGPALIIADLSELLMDHPEWFHWPAAAHGPDAGGEPSPSTPNRD